MWLFASTDKKNSQVLDKLEAYVAAPAFLSHLESVQKELPLQEYPQGCQVQVSVNAEGSGLSASIIEDSASMEAAVSAMESPDWVVAGSPEGEYVVVDKKDAVEALAHYIALYINRFPEAQRMEPKQLQQALSNTFKVVRRGKVKQVWEWGRRAYRWTALGYSALQMYQNPWLIQAVITILWTTANLVRRWY